MGLVLLFVIASLAVVVIGETIMYIGRREEENKYREIQEAKKRKKSTQ